MNRIKLKLKLLLSDRLAIIVYAVTLAVFFAVFSNLNLHAEEKSSIPIGLVCLDNSESAAALCDRVKALPTFYVYEGDLESLKKDLLDGYINSIFVIEEGYENNIRAGAVDELVSVYSGTDDKTSVLLQDIFAGCMMYDIVQNKGYNRYKRLSGGLNTATEAEYYSYALGLSKTEDFTFSFDAEYIGDDSGESRVISNSLLYKQIIAGMAAMLFAIISFTSHNQTAIEYEKKIDRRLKSAGYGAAYHVSDIIAAGIYCIPADILMALILSSGKAIFLKTVILNVIFSMFCVIIFWLAAFLVRNLQHYQLLGAFLVLLPGAAGFYSIFMGLTGGMDIIRFLPNSLYIRYFVNII